MRTLLEHQLLLEYDSDKTRAKYGEAIDKKMGNRQGHMWNWGAEDTSTWANEHQRFRTRSNRETGEFPVHNWKTFDAHSAAADPTPHREYGQWIARQYAGGGIKRLEDFGRLNTALSTFHEAKKRKLLQRHGLHADINRYAGLSELELHMTHFDVPEKESDKPAPEEYTKDEDEHWTHVVPHTQKAACYYGRGTKWCTAATNHNMFSHYSHPDDRLHIFIPKKAQHTGEKYQFHMGTGQYMDERDEDVDPHHVLGKNSSRPSEAWLNVHRHNLKTLHWNDSNPSISRDALTNVKFQNAVNWLPAEEIDHHVMTGNVALKTYAAHHFPVRYQALANDPSEDVKRTLAHRIPVRENTDHVVSKLLDDPSESVRAQMARRVEAPHHVDKALSDPSYRVRAAYVANGYDDVRAANHAVTDPHEEVRLAGARRFADSFYGKKFVGDSSSKVRATIAAGSPYKEVVQSLMNDSSEDVRQSAKWQLERRSQWRT